MSQQKNDEAGRTFNDYDWKELYRGKKIATLKVDKLRGRPKFSFC